MYLCVENIGFISFYVFVCWEYRFYFFLCICVLKISVYHFLCICMLKQIIERDKTDTLNTQIHRKR
jgi:hypothetical protein